MNKRLDAVIPGMENAEARELLALLMNEPDSEEVRRSVTRLCSQWDISEGLVRDMILIALHELRVAKEHRVELTHRAHTDQLTGALNRHGIAHHWQHSHEGVDGQVLLLIDLDNFKKVNDTYGHNVGDAVLKSIADRLHEMVRARDVTSRLGRHGGEEFLVILSGVDEEGAVVIAERIRSAVAHHHIGVSDTETINVTVSVGVHAMVPPESFDDAVRKADKALYRAKELGRNRVCVYGVDTPPG